MQKHWDNPAEHPMPEGVRVPASVKIGGVDVAPATFLAPMAGVTDTVLPRFIPQATPSYHSDAARSPRRAGCRLPAARSCQIGSPYTCQEATTFPN